MTECSLKYDGISWSHFSGISRTYRGVGGRCLCCVFSFVWPLCWPFCCERRLLVALRKQIWQGYIIPKDGWSRVEPEAQGQSIGQKGKELCLVLHPGRALWSCMCPPPPCINYALVQATVGVGTVMILYVI